MRTPATLTLTCALLLGAALPPVATADSIPRDEFVRAAFVGSEPAPRMLWLNEELQKAATSILGHPYRGMRVRYWASGERSAWILDEIGKELPITVGVVISGRKIEEVRILAFRESRGGEVRYPFFTDQFRGAGLSREWQLDRAVDGITGATMSVRAVSAVARWALTLDGARERDGSPALALGKSEP